MCFAFNQKRVHCLESNTPILPLRVRLAGFEFRTLPYIGLGQILLPPPEHSPYERRHPRHEQEGKQTRLVDRDPPISVEVKNISRKYILGSFVRKFKMLSCIKPLHPCGDPEGLRREYVICIPMSVVKGD